MSFYANKVAKCGSATDAKAVMGCCPFRSDEVGIIPVRYACDDTNGIDLHGKGFGGHPLPTNEAWKGPFNTQYRPYTLRQLRDGWVYVFNETQNQLDEYQLVGQTFTKIATIGDKSCTGEAKSCLVYAINDIISLAYAHQRWTPRVCSVMSESSSHRSAWMRTIDIHRFSLSLSYPHTLTSCLIGERVADIDVEEEVSQLFSNTCTPLVASDESTEGDFDLVVDKSPCGHADYRADLPDQSSSLFVALDDPLADLSDTLLWLGTAVAERNAITQDEDTVHKLQMAELTRSLGRVRLTRQELPEHMRDDPLRILEFETALTEYLATRRLADQERTSFESNPNVVIPPFTTLEEEAGQQLSELKRIYLFTPTAAQAKAWVNNTVFNDEVDWAGLDAYLTTFYQQMEGKQENLGRLLDECLSRLTQIGTNPLRIGLDNQDPEQLDYLLNLTSQSLAIIKQAPTTQKQQAALDRQLSIDSPNNLFALAPFGFSMEGWQALTDYMANVSHSVLSAGSPGDMIALSGAIANVDAFVGDVRIQEKAFFHAFVVPVKNTFNALQKAVTEKAAIRWRATMDLLFPSQYLAKNTPQNLMSNLRLVFIESLVGENAIVAHNPSYASELNVFHAKLQRALQHLESVYSLPNGSVMPKNHQIQQAKLAQQKIQSLLSAELPMMVTLKNNAANQTAKETINGYLESLWQKGKSSTGLLWNNVGGLGGIIALLNVINVRMVLQDVEFRAKQASGHHPYLNPIWREVAYAESYTISAVASLFRDAQWSKVIVDRKLIKMSIKTALRNTTSSNVALVKSFATSTAIVATFGMLASGLEAWESWDKAHDTLNDPIERVGYLFKSGATMAQTGIFFVQLATSVSSRLFGLGTINAILASWMVTGLAIAGVIYLISIIIINLFKRSELEKWLRQSTWGLASQHWEPLDEITKLEQIIHRPQVELVSVQTNRPEWTSSYTTTKQWQLSITFPSFTEGKMIGIQIVRQRQSSTDYGVEPPQKAIIINEQLGRWTQDDAGNPVFSVKLGGSDHDKVAVAIKMPLNWANSDEFPLGFAASGCQSGSLSVAPIEREIGARSMIVGQN